MALFFQMFDDAPVVLGANREEAYARGGEPPRELGLFKKGFWLRAVGGYDPVAGGTWLGVNERGVLVAVTNRPKSKVPAQTLSRGFLALVLLDCPNAPEAADLASSELKRDRFAGCNVLCADAENAVALHAGDQFSVHPLCAGLHVLTANDVDDPADTRQEFARAWLGRRHFARSEECVAALTELCGLTADAPMCLRTEKGGTVSSSVLALRRPLRRGTYLHAQGPPDVTPYADYSHLLRHIDPTPEA